MQERGNGGRGLGAKGSGADLGDAQGDLPVGGSRWNLDLLLGSCCRKWPCSGKFSPTALRAPACWGLAAGVEWVEDVGWRGE